MGKKSVVCVRACVWVSECGQATWAAVVWAAAGSLAGGVPPMWYLQVQRLRRKEKSSAGRPAEEDEDD